MMNWWWTDDELMMNWWWTDDELMNWSGLVCQRLPQTATDCHWLIGSTPLNTQSYLRDWIYIYVVYISLTPPTTRAPLAVLTNINTSSSQKKRGAPSNKISLKGRLEKGSKTPVKTIMLGKKRKRWKKNVWENLTRIKIKNKYKMYINIFPAKIMRRRKKWYKKKVGLQVFPASPSEF